MFNVTATARLVAYVQKNKQKKNFFFLQLVRKRRFFVCVKIVVFYTGTDFFDETKGLRHEPKPNAVSRILPYQYRTLFYATRSRKITAKVLLLGQRDDFSH